MTYPVTPWAYDESRRNDVMAQQSVATQVIATALHGVQRGVCRAV